MNENITIDNLNNTKNEEPDICKEYERSIETIILYRSLYIMKKKIDINKQKIKKLYRSFNLDKDGRVDALNSYQVNIENFPLIAESIFRESKILLSSYNNPKDIFLSSFFYDLDLKIREMVSILNDIKNYIIDSSLVQKYNEIYYNKKIKDNEIKYNLEQNKNKEVESGNLINHNEERIDKNKADVIKFNNKEDEKDKAAEKNKNTKSKKKKKIKDSNYEEEIQIKIVEYNRKGKIVRNFPQIINDNNTLEACNEKEQKDNRKYCSKKAIFDKKNKTNDKINNQDVKNDTFLIESQKRSMNQKENFIYDEKIYLLDIKNNINYNNIIYIETLPLIIADYLQNFPNYCIIETENELINELNVLFDKEIIQQMNKYEIAINKKNELQKGQKYDNILKNIQTNEENIKIYENLIFTKKEKGEDTSYLEEMLEKFLAKNVYLKNQIESYKKYESNIGINSDETNVNNSKLVGTNIKTVANNNKNKIVLKSKNLMKNQKITTNNNTGLTHLKSDKIENSLKEIFYFYTKQHNLVGSKGLFSNIEKNMEHLTISEFGKFCMEFNIPIIKQKIAIIYKNALKNADSTQNRLMNFSQFLLSLKLLSNNIHENKLELLKKSIDEERAKLKAIETRRMQINDEEKYIMNNLNNENSNKKNNILLFNKNKFYLECERTKLLRNILNLDTKLCNETKKTENELLNNLYKYLGINDENNEYKNKLQGFSTSFRIKEHARKYKNISSRIYNPTKNINDDNITNRINLKKENQKIYLSKKILEKEAVLNYRKKNFIYNKEKLVSSGIKRLKQKNYSDKLEDLKQQLLIKKQKEQRERELIEEEKKKEIEENNKLNWDKIEKEEINEDIFENNKDIFTDTDNSDQDILDKISSNKKLNKNKSAVELVSSNKLILPSINNKKEKEEIVNAENENEFMYKIGRKEEIENNNLEYEKQYKINDINNEEINDTNNISGAYNFTDREDNIQNFSSNNNDFEADKYYNNDEEINNYNYYDEEYNI